LTRGSASPARRGTALVLAAAVLFGTTGTAQELGPDDSDPLTVGALRLILGGAILFVFAATRPAGRAGLRAVVGSWVGLWCGAAVAVYNAFFFFGVDRAGVAIGTLVALGSAPFITGLLGWVIEGAAPARRWFVATAVSVAGLAVLVLSDSGGDAPSVLTGAACALVASTGYAVYTALGKQLIARAGPDVYIGGVFAIGAVVISPALLTGDLDWAARGSGIATVAWLGIVPTAIAYVLFGRGLRHLPASTVATLTLAEPLVATALGLLVLDESLDAVGLAGAALVLAGLAILAVRPARTAS
jgi:DME family drug/metabolite transporter